MLRDNTLKALFSLMAIFPSIAWSMQALDDSHLAQTTGQDGINVALGTKNNGGIIRFDRISLQDGDGFGTYTAPASIGYFEQTLDAGGIGFYSGTGTTAIAVPVSVVLDADGNSNAAGNNAVANVGIKFDSNLTRINIAPFSIRLGANSAANNHAMIAGSTRDLLKVGGTGIDIKFKTGSALGLNVQLANQPQGRFIVFSGGRIDEIANDPSSPIEISSYSGSTLSSSLKLNFSLKANAASTNGIQLKDMYVDLDASGMTFGKAGLIDKFDLTLSSIVAGTTGSQSTTSFNDLKNASIATIGVVGASVSNLKMTVKGL